jgi:hypothetical protein
MRGLRVLLGLSALVFAAPLGGCVTLLGDFTANGTADDGGPDASDDSTIGSADGAGHDGGLADRTGTPDRGEPGDGTGVSDTGLPQDGVARDSGACNGGQLQCDAGCVLGTDIHSCGSCGNDCTLLSHVDTSSLSCVRGTCTFQCERGFGHCSANLADGCEIDLSSKDHCGDCTTKCTGGTPNCGPSGNSFACVSGCPASAPTLCGTSCANLASDNAHCGMCAIACAGGRTCQSSTCACVAPQTDCSGNCYSTQSDATHCGAACTNCPVPQNGLATCTMGQCGMSCNAGFDACGGTTPCQYDTNGDPAHCGPNCVACAAPPHSMATCTMGGCGYVCSDAFSTCGGTTACAYDTNNDPTHCGANCTNCPVPSNGSATCTMGQCGMSCDPGFSSCGGTAACAYDTNNDPIHCGAGCTNCPAPQNGSAICTAGQCGTACNAGFSACGGTTLCQYDTNSDSNHCGVNCKVCGPPFVCTGGACGCPASEPTYCSGSNACIDTSSDANNCGTCGHSCQGAACSGGLCKPILIGKVPNPNGYGIGIAVSPTSVYFTDGNGGTGPDGGLIGGHLWSCPLSGCPVTLTPLLSAFNYAGMVAYDGASGNVAVSDNNNGRLWIVNGGASSPYNTGAPGAITTDGTYFYWTDFNGASRMVIAGGTVTKVWTNPASAALYPKGIAIDPSTGRVWIADQATAAQGAVIASCPADMSGPCSTWPVDYCMGIHIVRGVPYFVNSNGLNACASAADCSAPTVVTSTASNAEFTFDATDLYFYSYSGGIYRCPLGPSCPSPTLVTSSGAAADMTSDATFLYWIQGDGRVFKVAK